MQMVHDYLLMCVDNKLSSLFILDDLISQSETTALISMTVLWQWINKDNLYSPLVQNNVRQISWKVRCVVLRNRF